VSASNSTRISSLPDVFRRTLHSALAKLHDELGRMKPLSPLAA
jgi:hypothetical protein